MKKGMWLPAIFAWWLRVITWNIRISGEGMNFLRWTLTSSQSGQPLKGLLKQFSLKNLLANPAKTSSMYQQKTPTVDIFFKVSTFQEQLFNTNISNYLQIDFLELLPFWFYEFNLYNFIFLKND